MVLKHGKGQEWVARMGNGGLELELEPELEFNVLARATPGPPTHDKYIYGLFDKRRLCRKPPDANLILLSHKLLT
jgi:hypothetical protein